MENFFVTGLALGNYAGVCQAKNVDLQWFVNNPNIFLFSNKILIPSDIWKLIEAESLENKEFSKCINLVFQIAKSEGLIEIVNLNNLMSKKVANELIAQISAEFSACKKTKTSKKRGKYDPCDIKVGKIKVCPPIIWKIFASLYFSNKLNAQCMFYPHELLFLEERVKIKYRNKEEETLKAFSEILKLSIPQNFSFPDYAFSGFNGAQCQKCQKSSECKDSYLKETETNFSQFLKLRSRDDFLELKEIIKNMVLLGLEWAPPGGRMKKKPYQGEENRARYRALSGHFRH